MIGPIWDALTKAGAVKDGVVTKESLGAVLPKLFEQLRQRMHPPGAPGEGPFAGHAMGFALPTAAGWIAHLDKNKDGKLTKDEVPPPLWEHLTKTGAVKDGAVTKESLQAAGQKMFERFRERMQQAGSPAPGAAAPARRGHRAAALFDRFDKNKNGKLTKDDVPGPVWDFYTKIGAVKDGVVTKESLEACAQDHARET